MRLTVRVKDETKKVQKAAKKANFQNLSHAAASVRKEMVRKIRTSRDSARPGQPIRTRKGLARKAVRYHIDRAAEVAVIGPRFSVIKDALSAHEHGGRYRDARYPKRRFAAPSLEDAAPRLAHTWAGTIGQ
jgi:hypothetical protein